MHDIIVSIINIHLSIMCAFAGLYMASNPNILKVFSSFITRIAILGIRPVLVIVWTHVGLICIAMSTHIMSVHMIPRKQKKGRGWECTKRRIRGIWLHEWQADSMGNAREGSISEASGYQQRKPQREGLLI